MVSCHGWQIITKTTQSYNLFKSQKPGPMFKVNLCIGMLYIPEDIPYAVISGADQTCFINERHWM